MTLQKFIRIVHFLYEPHFGPQMTQSNQQEAIIIFTHRNMHQTCHFRLILLNALLKFTFEDNFRFESNNCHFLPFLLFSLFFKTLIKFQGETFLRSFLNEIRFDA